MTSQQSCQHPFRVSSLRTSTCMDLGRHERNASSRQTRPRHGVASLQQPRSSPLHQTEWSEIPIPFRPHDWKDPEEQRQELLSGPSYNWRLRHAVSGTELSSGSTNVPAPLRTRHRPRGLRDLTARATAARGGQVVDYSLLYPQLSPYEPLFSSRSAPDELQSKPRSVSQPSTPNHSQQRFEDVEPHPNRLPRSPTYPPAGRRRMQSHTGVQDAAFADEHEFRLFVEATAGLGPEQAFRSLHPHPSSRFVECQRSQNHDRSGDCTSPTEELVSPLEETPTTLRALQHLAQMPQASSEPPRRRLQAAASGLDLWLQPPTATSTTDVSPVEPVDDHSMYDELPDYASSQAQAQAGQRVEAARRAQELQRRWHQSGGARMP